jgi:hypothetical protein
MRGRFTIAGLMTVVAIVAINFALLPWPISAAGAGLSLLPALFAGPKSRPWRFYGSSALIVFILLCSSQDETNQVSFIVLVLFIMSSPFLFFLGLLAWTAKLTLDDHERQKALKSKKVGQGLPCRVTDLGRASPALRDESPRSIDDQ